MNISSVGSSAMPMRSEAAEGPGPDKVNDHDADDAAAVQQAVKAAKAAGTGTVVDKMA
jgi:hypothetical protein